METKLYKLRTTPEEVDLTVRAVWPTQQALNLGNSLVFRKEIELIAHVQKKRRAIIYFPENLKDSIASRPYFTDALLTSQIAIQAMFSNSIPERVDWPPEDPIMENWVYGSYKRIEYIHKRTQLFPQLEWPTSVLQQAGAFNLQFSGRGKVIAVHLKNQAGGSLESNATLSEWLKFFDHARDIQFILLGDDPIQPVFFSTPNVFSASHLGMPLISQLAFCSLAQAFMGMSSGISAAACLSKVPYVIFKHPDHHKTEMQIELGNSDQFLFAQERQKLWRRADTFENLKLGVKLCLGQ